MTVDTKSQRMFENADMSGVLVSGTIDVRRFEHLAIHATWTGATAAGDLILEVSAEIGGPVSWEQVTSVTVAGAGSQLWLDRNAPYTWARIRFVPTGGTGLLSVDAITKGDE